MRYFLTLLLFLFMFGCESTKSTDDTLEQVFSGKWYASKLIIEQGSLGSMIIPYDWEEDSTGIVWYVSSDSLIEFSMWNTSNPVRHSCYFQDSSFFIIKDSFDDTEYVVKAFSSNEMQIERISPTSKNIITLKPYTLNEDPVIQRNTTTVCRWKLYVGLDE